MSSKIVTREITSIMANYLYDHPLTNPRAPQQPPQQPPSPPAYRNITRPLDGYLRSYFAGRKYLGSSERSAISDKVYNLVRYEYLLSHLIRSRPYDIDRRYDYGPHLEQEITYKLNMLFSSDFYAAVDNPALPKYPPLHPGSSAPPRINCTPPPTQSFPRTQPQPPQGPLPHPRHGHHWPRRQLYS